MKKTFMILAVLLCAITVFAFENSVSLNVVPFGTQVKTSSIKAEEDVNSKYGIGAELSYKRCIYKGLFAEAGVTYETFFLKGNRSSVTNITPFAGVGFASGRIADMVSVMAHVDFVEDTIIYKGKAQAAMGFKTGLGANVAITDKISVNVLCDGAFTFSHDSEAKYVDYRVLPMVGVSYEF